MTSVFHFTLLSLTDQESIAVLAFEDSVEDFLYAIRKVSTGETFITPRITIPVVSSATAAIADSVEQVARLARREREVLRLIGAGKSNQEISRELRLGQSTVKSYVSRLLAKLKVRDRVQAALLASQLELLEPRSPDDPAV